MELAPIAGTAMVALAAYVGHVIVRGTKLSELRQAWVNDQRIDLAIVSARAGAIVGSRRGEHKADIRIDMIAFEEALERIGLRENPIKHEWHDVMIRLEGVARETRRPRPDPECVSTLPGGALAAARHRLKGEWTAIKEGEREYRRAVRWFKRWAFAGLVVVAGVAWYDVDPKKPIDVRLLRPAP